MCIRDRYVQSKIGHTYQEEKKLLQTGCLVCFSGTPCQIAGLKHYLKKDYANLITVDLAVSYTHLDVYKRQLRIRGISATVRKPIVRWELTEHLSGTCRISPRLDVYKRQNKCYVSSINNGFTSNREY